MKLLLLCAVRPTTVINNRVFEKDISQIKYTYQSRMATSTIPDSFDSLSHSDIWGIWGIPTGEVSQ